LLVTVYYPRVGGWGGDSTAGKEGCIRLWYVNTWVMKWFADGIKMGSKAFIEFRGVC
jgi:hypothetical protein